MRRRIAIWTYGGVGGGLFAQGIPTLVKIVEALADKYSIVVYSFVSVNSDYIPGNFLLQTPPKWLRPTVFRWIYLICVFLFHHIRNPFQILVGFWAFPAGFIVTILSKLLNKPSLVNTQGGDVANIPEINYGVIRKRIPRSLTIWTLRKATVVMTLTRFQMDGMLALGVQRVFNIVPWGADKSMFTFREKSWDQLKCLHVANLNAVKDQGTLIRAFAEIVKVKPAQLKIVGGDFFNGRIQQLVNEFNLEDQIEFVGAVPHAQVKSYCEWANVMIHSSMYEGLCMSLVEAAASGHLLAGTRVGILYDLGSECCINVDVKDYKMLASEIIGVTSNRELCEQKVRKAKEWSDAHDFSWTIDQFEKVIDREIDRGNQH